MAEKIEIRPPASETELAAVKALIEAYVASLGVDLSHQDYDDEIARFPDVYRAMLLALVDGKPAGSVALKDFAEGACEMKRLYCDPAFRGLGLGRRLALAIIAEARNMGYRRMLLDTLKGMDAAQALYATLGFRPVPAYYENPIEDTVYMELDLARPATGAD